MYSDGIFGIKMDQEYSERWIEDGRVSCSLHLMVFGSSSSCTPGAIQVLILPLLRLPFGAKTFECTPSQKTMPETCLFGSTSNQKCLLKMCSR
jgi:hypothetical protein